jgi:hypothetical protein
MFKIIPKHNQAYDLKSATGLKHYHINCEITEGVIEFSYNLHPIKIPIYAFPFDAIVEEAVREHMIKVTMQRGEVSREKALEILRAIPINAPKSEIKRVEKVG